MIDGQVKTGITITKSMIEEQYKILNSEGKYTGVKVASTPKRAWINPALASASANYSHSYLINLKAVEARNVDRLIDTFGDEEEVDLGEFNGIPVVFEMIVNANPETGEVDEPVLPARNEEVTLMLQYARTKDGELVLDQNDQQILNVVDMRINPAKKAKNFSFGRNNMTVAEGQKEEKASKEKSKESKKETANA